MSAPFEGAAARSDVTETRSHVIPSVIGRLRYTLLRTPNAVALRARGATGEIVDSTYAALWRSIGELSLGLEALGVARGDRVLLYGENGPELVVADLATIACRALSVPLYPGAPTAAIRAHVRHCAPKVAIVESGPPLARFLEAVRDLPERPRAVAIGDRVPGAGGEIRALSSIQADGRRRLERAPRAFEDMADASRVADDLTIAYTAGAGGAPRGAVLRHENAIGFDLDWLFPKIGPGDLGLVHLPLASSFARLCVVYRLLFAGATVALAEARGRVVDGIAALRPTHLFAHQGVLDAAEQQIFSDIRDATKAKRGGGFAAGLLARLVWRRGRGKLAGIVLARQVHALFGGRLKVLYVGGLANRATIRFMHDAGLPIYRGYGMAELTPLVAANRPDVEGERRWKPGTSGRPVHGVKVEVRDGEILVKGALVARSYWRAEPAADVLDPDGWFHTGDLGRLDEDGFVIVEDRKADVIRLADGTEVLPRPVETKLRESRLIAQAALIGGGRPHAVALVVPHFGALAKAAEARKLGALKQPELLSDPRVRAIVEEDALRRLAAFPAAARPRKIRILSMRFSEAGGELSPAQGLRRGAIEEKYRAQIEAMYA